MDLAMPGQLHCRPRTRSRRRGSSLFQNWALSLWVRCHHGSYPKNLTVTEILEIDSQQETETEKESRTQKFGSRLSFSNSALASILHGVLLMDGCLGVNC